MTSDKEAAEAYAPDHPDPLIMHTQLNSRKDFLAGAAHARAEMFAKHRLFEEKGAGSDLR